jgi:hypothetical protein
MEIIENNSVYWLLGFALLALIITIVGIFTSAKLPAEQRLKHRRKFALVGAAIFFFGIPVFKPTVWTYSGVRNLDKIEVADLGSADQELKLEKEQARQIERLKEEVIELRREVRDANRYYSTVFQLLSNIAAMLCLIFAFRKDEQAVENITE